MRRMLLWRQPTGDCYVAITSGADSVARSQTAKCVILGVKARFEKELILDYDKVHVPVGDDLRGCVVDYMCSVKQRAAEAVAPAPDSSIMAGAARVSELPLMNEQVLLENREVMSEPLYTGIKVRACYCAAWLGLCCPTASRASLSTCCSMTGTQSLDRVCHTSRKPLMPGPRQAVIEQSGLFYLVLAAPHN